MTLIEAISGAKYKQLIDPELPPTVDALAAWCCEVEPWLWALVSCNEAHALTMLAANAAAMRAERCARALGATDLAEMLRKDPGVFNISGRDALNRIGECRRWCESVLAGTRFSVNLESLTAVLTPAGRPAEVYHSLHPQAARWLSVLVMRPGEWHTPRDLENSGKGLSRVRVNKLILKVPDGLRRIVENVPGKGSRINLGLAQPGAGRAQESA